MLIMRVCSCCCCRCVSVVVVFGHVFGVLCSLSWLRFVFAFVLMFVYVLLRVGSWLLIVV